MSEKTVAQKLLIKENQRLLLVNTPTDWQAALGALPAGVSLLTRDEANADVILLFSANQVELERYLPGLKTRLSARGMLWVIYYKLTSKKRGDIQRDSINVYARSLGLEGIAMISVDEDLSALRLKVVA